MLTAMWSELGPLSEQAFKYASVADSPHAEAMPPSIARQFAALVVSSSAGVSAACVQSEAQSQTFFNLTCLALALAAFRHDHGSYPRP